jgi:hypothetical protein
VSAVPVHVFVSKPRKLPFRTAGTEQVRTGYTVCIK